MIRDVQIPFPTYMICILTYTNSTVAEESETVRRAHKRPLSLYCAHTSLFILSNGLTSSNSGCSSTDQLSSFRSALSSPTVAPALRQPSPGAAASTGEGGVLQPPIVKCCMVHVPCGRWKPDSDVPCMKDGKCSKGPPGFLKAFRPQTVMIYRSLRVRALSVFHARTSHVVQSLTLHQSPAQHCGSKSE
ncbi:hypothetical protein F5888DRAFT_634029 [Russula emetica]|nr:hypothetical protein F5888DRAFT_634029 [Russula emetica]